MRYTYPSIGDMNRRIKIMRSAGTRDVVGGMTEAISEVDTVWANVKEQLKERQTNEGDIEYFSEYEVFIRPHSSLTDSDYLQINEANCAIVAMTSISKTLTHIKARRLK